MTAVNYRHQEPLRHWTHEELIMAAAANRAADTALLLNFGRSRLESDLARWALLGRTSDQALSILNGRGEGVANNAPSVAAE